MNALTEEILETLSDLAFHPHRLFYGRLIKEYSRKSLGVTVQRLEQKGYIERGMMEDDVCIKLTEFGIKKLEEKRNLRKEKALLNLTVKNEKWDGKWRIVIFDIPEINKRIRQVLRETLKVLEFWPLQKSVWISKKDYTKELRKWVRELGLSQYVLIFETGDLGVNLR